MKKLLLAGAAVVALAAPLGAAHAHSNVIVRVDTPNFGIRVGTPVYPAPVHAPRPVYVAVPPPRVIVPAPVYRPHPRHVHHRHGHGHHDHRHDHRHGHRH